MGKLDIPIVSSKMAGLQSSVSMLEKALDFKETVSWNCEEDGDREAPRGKTKDESIIKVQGNRLKLEEAQSGISKSRMAEKCSWE